MSNRAARRLRKRRAFSNQHTTQKMSNVIALPSGKTATIRTATGRDVRKAQQMSGTDTSMYMNCFMSLCVEIEGANLVPEQFDDLSAQDYIELMAKFQAVNFPSGPTT